MEMSADIKELAAAFSKAQAAVEGATKGAVNPAFRTKYADLGAVWDACRDALTSNGLSVVQFPGEMADNRMTMTTMLMHSSGQWMREKLSIPLGKVDAQGYGSATTYARRYALAAVVGVCPEDDDGNAASRKPEAPANDAKAHRAPPLTGPIKTRAELRKACGAFVHDLHGCGDQDTLDIVLTDNAALIQQVRAEAEQWWKGDGADFLGLEKEIAAARARIGTPVWTGELLESEQAALRKLDECDTPHRLSVWLDDNKAIIDTAEEASKQVLRAAYAARKKGLEAVALYNAA